MDGDTLFVNQYTGAELNTHDIKCKITTEYPNDGRVVIKADGVKKIAFRIPFWCDSFKVNKTYTIERGYAYVENDGTVIEIDFDMPVSLVYANPAPIHCTGKVCVMRGPVVYCAESIDNVENLHSIVVSDKLENLDTKKCDKCGLTKLSFDAKKIVGGNDGLYSVKAPLYENIRLKLIPYSIFANRGESDMIVWIRKQ